MSKNRDLDFLTDILEATHRTALYIESMDITAFLDDIKTQDAVIRTIEIIGEATKNLTPELREKYPDVPWRNMARVRDKLIHHYFGVNIDIIWQIASEELPTVAAQIQTIIDNLNSA